MTWILLLMGFVVSVLAAMLVGGLATPRTHVASRTILLKASPQTVWQLIRNVAGYPDWRDDIQSVSVDADSNGALQWTEIGRQKALSYRATVDEAPHRFTSQIADEDLGYSGEWQYVVTPTDSGTRVTITETGHVGNPMRRFFSHFVGHTRAMDSYLTELALQLGEHTRPQPAEP